jgi:hypothetical protein
MAWWMWFMMFGFGGLFLSSMSGSSNSNNTGGDDDQCDNHNSFWDNDSSGFDSCGGWDSDGD